MDEWGRDPSVRAMRGIFKTMEDTVDGLLKQLNISPLDHRVRGWLEQALANYERAWVEARRQGVPMEEKMATAVYGHCLGKVIGADGIKIPEKALAIESDVGELIREVVK
jgi:hypothetical protein